MADIVTEVKAAGAALKGSALAIGAAALVLVGVGAAEVYEHTFRLDFLFVKVEGLGQRLTDVQPTLKAAATNLAQCQANSATLQAAIDRQNAAVAAWKASGDKATAAAQSAVQAAQQASQQADKRVTAIMAQKVSTCADIHALREEN